MTGRRTIYFNDGTIEIDKQPNGEYTAIDPDSYDGHGSAMGWGDTEWAAMSDLVSQLRERGIVRDD